MSSETDDNRLIQAADAWRAARDKPAEGRALALAVVAACGPGDEEALVVALRAQGWAERVLYLHRDSGRSLNRAVRIARRHGLDDRLAEALISRASLALELGRSRTALRDLAAARAALGGRSTIDLDAQEALVQMKFGHHARAVEVGLHARHQIGSDTDPVTQVMVLTNLGEALSHLGRAREAEEAFIAGEAVAERVGRLNLGMVIQTRAAAAVRGGRLAEALAGFDRAEALLTEAGWPLGEHYLERIDSLVTLRLIAEADLAVERAVSRFESAGFVLLLAEARLRQARLCLDDGRFDEAASAAAHASELFQRQRRFGYRAQADIAGIGAHVRSGTPSARDLRRAEGAAVALEHDGAHLEAVDAHVLIGRLADALGRRDVARDHFELALAGSRHGGSLLRLKGCVAEALLARQAGDANRIRRAARRGLNEVARYRSSLPSTELRALASGHGVELASLGLASTLGAGRPDRVLEWMERGRLASLLTDPPRARDPMLDELFGRLREVMGEQRPGGDDPEQLGRLRAEQARLEMRIERRMRTLDPAGGEAGRIATATEIKSAISGRSLVELASIDGRIVAVTVAERRAAWDLGSLEAAMREAEALQFGLRRVMRSRTPASLDAARAGIRHSLEQLDRQLVRPLVGSLCDEVVFVPTASLFAVPWHALPSLADHRVSVAPSATVWARAAGSRPSGGRIVVAAGPDLAGAIDEVEAIGPLYPGAIVLSPPSATVSRVAGDLDGAALAHLACHGSFRADNPGFSRLELADGPLTVLDLESMGRTPDIVVLASCDSGASQALPGDELRGFLSALFMLGTRCVVASAVPVPDVESTSLMRDLHRGLAAGLGVGAALDRARSELDPSEPAGLVMATAYAQFGAAAAAVVAGP